MTEEQLGAAELPALMAQFAVSAPVDAAWVAVDKTKNVLTTNITKFFYPKFLNLLLSGNTQLLFYYLLDW